MRFIDKKQKLDYLVELINKENTGNADRLKERICVSNPTLKRYLQDLREMGYLISYCTYRKTYYFINRPIQ